jgi:hypothetical protein
MLVLLKKVLDRSGWRKVGSVEPTVGEWMGGKCVGNIQLINNRKYYLRYKGQNLASVSLQDFPSPDKAFTHAKRLLRDYCVANSLLINPYRYVRTPSDQWLEVKVQDACFTCDIESLSLVEGHTWRLHPRDHCISSSRNLLFYHALFPSLPLHAKVYHVDGNSLNNRKCNLSLQSYSPVLDEETGKIVNVKNKGKCWAIMNGNKEVKSFSVTKYGVVEARKLAIVVALKLEKEE